jgi:hypothetical protein
MVSEANQKAIEAAGLSFILGMRIPHVPYVVNRWRREHPGEQIPDGHFFTQPWPAGPDCGRRDQVIYYQYRHERARRTLRGIDEQVKKAGQAVAGNAPVKRNRFIQLSGGGRSRDEDLPLPREDCRAVAGESASCSLGVNWTHRLFVSSGRLPLRRLHLKDSRDLVRVAESVNGEGRRPSGNRADRPNRDKAMFGSSPWDRPYLEPRPIMVGHQGKEMSYSEDRGVEHSAASNVLLQHRIWWKAPGNVRERHEMRTEEGNSAGQRAGEIVAVGDPDSGGICWCASGGVDVTVVSRRDRLLCLVSLHRDQSLEHGPIRHGPLCSVVQLHSEASHHRADNRLRSRLDIAHPPAVASIAKYPDGRREDGFLPPLASGGAAPALTVPLLAERRQVVSEPFRPDMLAGDLPFGGTAEAAGSSHLTRVRLGVQHEALGPRWTRPTPAGRSGRSPGGRARLARIWRT